MSKFQGTPASKRSGPISVQTTTGPARTFEGGAAFSRDVKSELFNLAVVNMVGESTFYEAAGDRDSRYVRLIHEVAVTDPAWLYLFLGWLRNKANMRSAALVGAAEALKARLDAGLNEPFEVNRSWVGDTIRVGNKDFVPQGMARADEPGEFLAYWASKWGEVKEVKPGRLTAPRLPMAVKRGLSLAANDLFGEYAYMKYGRVEDGYSLADVVELSHVAPKDDKQSALYRHAINERHDRKAEIPQELVMLQRRKEIMAIPVGERRAFLDEPTSEGKLKAAGITWEALSGWLQGPLDAAFWERLIFSRAMGYGALLKNLANFERAGISKTARKNVQDRLSDPGEVAGSRLFPYRFLSAYRAVQSDWWSECLSDALDASLSNLAHLPGSTLVLADTSQSMRGPVTERSKVQYIDVAALTAVAVAKACDHVEFYGFANHSFRHELPKGGSVLKAVRSFSERVGEAGGGTETVKALRETWRPEFSRVIVVTDMQAFADYSRMDVWHALRNVPQDITAVSSAVPEDVVMYGLGSGGYAATGFDLSRRNRYEISGFSDQVFKMMSLLERGDGGWPF